MLHVFTCDLKWIPGNVTSSLMEKISVLTLEKVDSFAIYQKIVIDLSTVKEHLLKKLTGIQGWIQWFQNLFSERGRLYPHLVREVDHIKTICLIFAHLQLHLKEKLIVENNVQ